MSTGRPSAAVAVPIDVSSEARVEAPSAALIAFLRWAGTGASRDG